MDSRRVVLVLKVGIRMGILLCKNCTMFKVSCMH